MESHYSHFVQMDATYLTELNRYFRARVAEVTDQAQGLTGEELTCLFDQG